jgi:protein SCO1/2
MRGPLVLLALLAAGQAAAHDGVVHATPSDAAAHAAASAAPGPVLPFPVEIEMRFRLIDHAGQTVSEADFAGRPVALFFGYASCESICSVALPRMAEALDLLGPDGAGVTPVMITVDPARDTPERLAEAMPKWHPRMVGLTGSEDALADARRAFQVEVSEVARDAAGEPIYAHGGFVYLIGGDGAVVSVVPPILGPERMAELMRRHLVEAPAG